MSIYLKVQNLPNHWLGKVVAVSNFTPLKINMEPTQMVNPGRFRWNLQITRLERNMIFQTSMIMFHVNLQGCITTTCQEHLHPVKDGGVRHMKTWQVCKHKSDSKHIVFFFQSAERRESQNIMPNSLIQVTRCVKKTSRTY